MSSKSKKKDKKKSKTKNDKIELTEIEEAANPALSGKVSTASSKTSAPVQKAGYKVKVFPAPGAQTDKKYEEAASAALNSPDFDGYELLSILPSSDSKKLLAFFKLSK